MMAQETGLAMNDQKWPEHSQYWNYLDGKVNHYSQTPDGQEP